MGVIRMSQGSRGALLFVASNIFGRSQISEKLVVWYELTSFTRKGSFQSLPLGQPLDPSQVCEAMASKEVRHLGFGKLCCVAKP